MPPKQSADLLIEARWVLPIAPVNRALRGHALVVNEGKILAIGALAELDARFEVRERIVRSSHVLLPGFVNAHTRAAMTLLRGFPASRPLMPSLPQASWPAEPRWLSPDFVRDGTLLAIAEMLRAGITSFADTYLFPEEAARIAAGARLRAVIGLPVIESATAWAENANGYLANAERIWDEFHDNPWVRLQFAPHAPDSLEDATLKRVRRVADELDARIVMQVNATENEVSGSCARYGKRPLSRLDDLGLLRPGFTATHMNCLDASDLDLVAHRAIAIVACPQTSLRLGNGACPLDALSERNVTVGLGTDAPPDVGALDVLAEARTATLRHPGISVEKALELATLEGATAIGLGAEIGSLEPGKSADLICVNLDALSCEPTAAVAEALVLGAARTQVSDVWIAGRPAVKDSRLLAFDEQELLALARSWSRRIHGDER